MSRCNPECRPRPVHTDRRPGDAVAGGFVQMASIAALAIVLAAPARSVELPPALPSDAAAAVERPGPGPEEDPHSLYERGMLIERTEHGPSALARAQVFYCRAARLGSPEALMRLGWIYTDGQGQVRDEVIGQTLFRRAAGFSGHGDRLPPCLRQPFEPLVLPAPGSVSDPATVTLAQPPAIPRPAEFEPAVLSPGRKELVQTVIRMARDYKVDPRLVFAVMQTESNYDPNAQSPKNAQGLMQLIPETAERFAVLDPFDPIQNLRGGMGYLRWLLAYFRGDVVLALAGYNAGEGAVDRHRGVPPFPETLAYVQRIRALYPHDRHAFDPRVASPPAWLGLGADDPGASRLASTR